MKDPMIADNALSTVAETIDRLISLDFRNRPITGGLYAAAREQVGAPLAYTAARLIARALDPLGPQASPKSAIICTGFMIRSAGQPETDGLTGAALLARGLAGAFGILPILATEDGVVDPLRAACAAAGVHTSRIAIDAVSRPFADLVANAAGSASAAILSFPAGSDPASLLQPAGDVLSWAHPGVVISIERPGANRAGVHHNSRGQSISDIVAPIDELFTAALGACVPTIAIGDFGNELGMGVVADALRRSSPLGAQCACPCGAGIACDTPADVTVVGAVSDDAAYGILACLAALRGDAGILPTPDMLQAALRAAVCAGAVDGLTGRSEYSIDMLGEAIHCALLGLMGAVLTCASSYDR